MSMTRQAIEAELQHRGRLGRATRCVLSGELIQKTDDVGCLLVTAGRAPVEDGCISTACISTKCMYGLRGFLQGRSVGVGMVDKRVMAFPDFDFRLAGFPDPAPVQLHPKITPGNSLDAFGAGVGCRANVGKGTVCGACELPLPTPDFAQAMLAVVTGRTGADGWVLTAFLLCDDCIRGNVYPETEDRIEQCVRPAHWFNPGKFFQFPRRVNCVVS